VKQPGRWDICPKSRTSHQCKARQGTIASYLRAAARAQEKKALMRQMGVQQQTEIADRA